MDDNIRSSSHFNLQVQIVCNKDKGGNEYTSFHCHHPQEYCVVARAADQAVAVVVVCWDIVDSPYCWMPCPAAGSLLIGDGEYDNGSARAEISHGRKAGATASSRSNYLL